MGRRPGEKAPVLESATEVVDERRVGHGVGNENALSKGPRGPAGLARSQPKVLKLGRGKGIVVSLRGQDLPRGQPAALKERFRDLPLRSAQCVDADGRWRGMDDLLDPGDLAEVDIGEDGSSHGGAV